MNNDFTLKVKLYRKGFTLIELLVVVSIISLLSSIVLAGLQEARDKAYSIAFRQEIDQFILALELYNLDNGTYPLYDPNSGENDFIVYTDNTTCGAICDTTKNKLVNKYIPKLPEIKKQPAIRAIAYGFIVNVNSSKKSSCWPSDSATLPKYIVYVRKSNYGNPLAGKAFSDWKIGRQIDTGLPDLKLDYYCYERY